MPRVVTLSPEQSQISTDLTAIAADGAEVCTVSVTVKNTDQTGGEPNAMQSLAASNVVLAVTPSTGVTITQPTGVANSGGAVTGSFVSTNATTVSVTATVLGVAVTSGSPSVVVGGGPPPEPDPGDPFYTQGTTEATARANADGFTWSTGNARTSVAEVPAGRSGWGLQFRYGPDADGADSSAEQRFNMGRDLAAVWIEYSLYVPANFAHRSQASSTNNKFLMIWNTTYGSGSGTWQAGYEYTRSTATASNVRIMSSLESGTNSLFVTDRASFADNGKAFIGTGRPLVPGSWHTIRLQFQRSSASEASDGVMRVWIDGTLFAESFGKFRNNADAGTTVLKQGYFMGWSNSGFTEETLFFIHGAKFYDTDPGWT
jgi:hypothetical protein